MFQRNGHPSNFIKSGLEMIRKARAQCSRKGQKLSPTWRLFLRWWRTSWSHSAPVLHIDQLHSSSKAYHEPRARWSPGRNQMWSTKLYALVIIAASTTSVNQEQIQQHRWAVLQASCDTSRSTVHDLHTPGCDRACIKWTSRTHHPGTSQDQLWTRIQRVLVFWQESNQQAHWIGSNLLFVPLYTPSCLNQACTNKPTAWARETHHHVIYAIHHHVKVNRALIDIWPRSDQINKQAVKNCNQQWLWSIMVTIISQTIHQDTKRHAKRQPFVTITIQRAPFHQALLGSIPIEVGQYRWTAREHRCVSNLTIYIALFVWPTRMISTSDETLIRSKTGSCGSTRFTISCKLIIQQPLTACLLTCSTLLWMWVIDDVTGPARRLTTRLLWFHPLRWDRA